MGCFSHTLDHVGWNLSVLDEFMKVWIELLTRSPKAKLAWREATGLPVPTYSTTQWWLMMRDMLVAFDDVGK